MKNNKFLSLGLICLITLSININLKSKAENERKGQSTNLHVPSSEYGKKGEDDSLKKGDIAPNFSAKDSNGKLVNLNDFKGKNSVLLVFYPGDNTPGCTKQLCAIRDDYKDLEKLGVVVFGINQADKKSHNKFIKDFKFPFQLIIDEDFKISKNYNAVNFFGFINRTVVLINKEGKIVLYERGMPELKPSMISKLI